MSRITISLPDISGRAMTQAALLAVDAALAEHRRAFLPLHFRRSATERYPIEYAQHAANVAKREARRRAILTKSPHGNKISYPWISTGKRGPGRGSATLKNSVKYHRIAGTERRDREQDAQKLDPRNEIPLVDSGRLRLTVLAGSTTPTGRLSVRALKFNAVPWYLFPFKASQIDKVRALQALHPEESQAAVTSIERDLSAYLATNTQHAQA
jgi:hypothetical protein